jgi:hypothetical protein
MLNFDLVSLGWLALEVLHTALPYVRAAVPVSRSVLTPVASCFVLIIRLPSRDGCEARSMCANTIQNIVGLSVGPIDSDNCPF